MGDPRLDLDPKLLRSFVTVAAELHFTRAATRLYLTQQAVSRHIRRLEDDLGVALFDRTSRQVALTAAGRRLLPRARQLLDLHDRLVAETRGHTRPLLVDGLAEGLTPTLLVEEAREAAPQIEFLSRFSGGVAVALTRLLGRELDVVFGRSEGGRRSFEDHLLVRRLVRLEPLGLLLPEDHPFANRSAVPAELLDATQIDISAGNQAAPEWIDLAEGFLRLIGAEPSPPHAPAVSAHETARHLRAHGRPILAMTQSTPVEGASLRPITDPVPLYPWAMIHHKDLDHQGLEHLHSAIDEAIERWGWLQRPPDSWVPPADGAVFDL